MLDGRNIILFDTRGFDENIRPDTETFELFVTWLKEHGWGRSYLDGLVYVHPIYRKVDELLQKRMRILERLLGQDPYKKLIIATSMWNYVTDDTAHILQDRIRAGVWENIQLQDVRVEKHGNDATSAQKIIKQLVETADQLRSEQRLSAKESTAFPIRFFRSSAGQELKGQLEGSIRELQEALTAHQKTRPKSWTSWRDWESCQENLHRWRSEEAMMRERLELRTQQLKRLNSTSVSVCIGGP
ncbi:hypothetical protein QBC34DRAFT_305538 [Podospora aff. communis PSN243]|uniref:G domain-containing protein n=1 Tax=Podospora aff. communis PSN243 TaxID=3040156 RepID=A0AAV9GBD5_9PEZI|nr:hypothetical protein QBC34DRAFT_305538 [Podospora aff. communis PSN243]